MATAELFVGLKVPDNVALTAFHTLHSMGYNSLKNLERQDYYKFEFSGDKKAFEKKISQVDILINANKHKFSFSSEDNGKNSGRISILVQNLGTDSRLLRTLKERLGFKNLKSAERGVLWTMHFDGHANSEDTAVEIAKGLLMNENYQTFKVLSRQNRL